MGARWAWTAVCSGPEHHVYSNFSGGADDCYDCGAEPEVEYQDDISGAGPAEEYATRRRSGVEIETINEEAAIAQLHWLAEQHGYTLHKRGQ